ncbi:hypothetical protein ACFLT4_04430 [Chloroflexota bacterium]
MKLRKNTLLLIVAGVFVIASAGLIMVRSQQLDEQNQLNGKLTQVQLNLGRVKPEQLSSRQAELEEQLSQATSQFEVVEAVLSQPVGSVNVTSALFDIAKANGVEVTEMASSGRASESLEGLPCSVISLTAKVEGDVSNLVSFITRLNSFFTTGVVKSITITVPGTSGGENSSADIHLVVYSYQGK